MCHFKGMGFSAQFPSPKLMQDFKLFTVLDDDRQDELEVMTIHDETGFLPVTPDYFPPIAEGKGGQVPVFIHLAFPPRVIAHLSSRVLALASQSPAVGW